MSDSNDEPVFSWERREAEVFGTPQTSDHHHPDGSRGESREPTRDVPVLVDSPEAQQPERLTLARLRSAERRPIVPAWARSRSELADNARWLGGLAWHYSLYHACRTPKYAGRLALRAPAGTARGVRAWAAWLFDAEGRAVRKTLDRREDAETYHRLAKHRDRRVRTRAILTIATLAMLAAGLLGLALAPWWARLAATLATLGILGKAGQPPDKPLLDTAVVIDKAPRLTSVMVQDALVALRVAGIKSRDDIEFTSEICRDGRGYRAEMNLPLGVTPGDIVDKRPELASGLRRKLGCVWPEGDPTAHEGRLVLWVGDRDLAEIRGAKGLTWALARSGQHDIFKPAPFGADARGRPVPVPFIQHNWLIGAMPGQGKTGVVVVLSSAAALDPLVELWPHELKGSGDLDAYEQVAHRFCSGIDDDSIGYAADSLSLLRAEVVRRTGALKRLPRDLCPDKRVTRQIAERRTLGLHPLVCVIDECQNLFAHATYGNQAGEDAEFIIKIGRAFGVVLILATQRPDKDSLPTGVSGNVSIRFCLKVPGQVENDMILGTSAYKRGLNAALFRPEIDAGIGYLVGATSAPTVACAAYLDVAARERVAARAKMLRERAGTLSGHALGEAPESSPRAKASLLADILAVVPASKEKVWCQTAAARLAELRPDMYGGWGAEQVTLALKPFGVAVGAVWDRIPDGEDDERQGATRRGFVRQDVAEAHARRTRRAPGEGAA